MYYNVIMKRVRVAIVAVKKSVLHIMNVCLLLYLVCSVRVLYCHCGLSGCTRFFTLSHNTT
jgi:hypothetical protein